MYLGSGKGRLVYSAYPFVLDSADFPSIMASVAQKLQPSCTVSWNSSSHWLVDVTYKGVTKSYGGAGDGESDPVYSNHVKTLFTFTGKASDYAAKGTVAKYRSKLMEFKRLAAKDAKKYRDQLSGETFMEKVAKGTWIRVGYERMFDTIPGYFAYYVSNGNGTSWLASDMWVDGRYVDDHEVMVVGAKFADHPTASIVKRNVKYTDVNGKKHVRDLVFNYQYSTGDWRATDAYFDYSYSYGSTKKLPSKFILTKKQVKAMKLGSVSSRPPQTGLVYDGDEAPGTRFKVKFVKGVSISSKSKTLKVGGKVQLKVKVKPAKATYKAVVWSSSNEKVATVNEAGEVTGVAAGKAKIKAVTVDGNRAAACKVTVKRN